MNPEIDPKSESMLIGDCRYDHATGALTGADGVPIRLRKQSAEVLAVLAENPGEVVSREKLIESVWKDVATTDDSLIQCIADIRRAIGKDAVETFPKIGYRLAVSATPQTERPARSFPVLAAVLAIALLTTGMGGWLFLERFSGG